EEIERMVEGGEDKESYASKFNDSILNDDVDDSGNRIEPGSHKEHSENVNNDDKVIEKEKKNDEIGKEKKDDDVEKMDEIEKEKKDDDVEKIDEIEKETKDDVEKIDEVVKEKDNDEFASGSMEFRNEKMQTPIPTPTRSPRTNLSFDKTIIEELTATVSPTTATISKDSSIPKRKKRSLSYKAKILLGSIADMCRRHGQIR
ncbi:hypothetical protein Tco_1364018, partial [Tanacetum coccineum]